MKGYFNKLLIFIAAGVMVTLLMWVVNSGVFVSASYQDSNQISILPEPENPKTEETEIRNRKKTLILYSQDDDVSVKLSGNLEKVCRWLKTDYQLLDVTRQDTVSYMEYDLLIIAAADIENGFGTGIARVMDYVDKGGRLFWAIMPEEMGSSFNSVYRKLGITDVGGFVQTDGLKFCEELIPGSKGLAFEGEEFTDIAVAFQLESSCKIYVESAKNRIPVIWSYDYGEGKTIFYNATSSSVDFFTGMLAGCITELYDEFMYPVINAKVIFIDDFPSMQYNSDSDVIKEEYNRTVKEFYRDIWWPDMQSAAKKYDIAYTGLFMATYNNIVEPENFEYVKDEMEQYYGNSLLKNNFEMGAHGYNHQSLTLAGGTPEEMGYNPWKSREDMAASLKKLIEITDDLFSDVKFQTYVPPSNYLSETGRAAVVEALPDLKVISGVYTKEGSEGDVYVQDFEIAEDGVAEFPRITSGMLESDYDDFIALNGCGLYGVYSHFIHPDDILDEERSGGHNWQELLDNYCDRLNLINERYNGLRALTASTAADALKIAYNAEVSYTVMKDRIVGKVYDFYGETEIYLKSERKPKSASEGCTITPITNVYDTDYYLVKVTKPSFMINLEE